LKAREYRLSEITPVFPDPTPNEARISEQLDYIAWLLERLIDVVADS
jgi:hypothetical protein